MTPAELLPDAMVGIAKNASLRGDTVTYDYYLEHFGNTLALNASILQDFDVVFGAGNYSFLSLPAIVSGPSTLSLNPNFDGSIDTQLIAAGSEVAVGETAQISLTLTVDNATDQGYGLGRSRNQVAHIAEDGNGTVYRDASDDGRDSDPNDDDDPTGADESDPTISQTQESLGKYWQDLSQFPAGR